MTNKWILVALRCFQEKVKIIDRTLNRHRWVSRADSGAWENYVEGTRQNDLVTSGEGVLNLEQSLFSDTKSGGATV